MNKIVKYEFVDVIPGITKVWDCAERLWSTVEKIEDGGLYANGDWYTHDGWQDREYAAPFKALVAMENPTLGELGAMIRKKDDKIAKLLKTKLTLLEKLNKAREELSFNGTK